MALPTDGMILVDKPAGWTSFDVVAKLRGQLRAQTGKKKVKVGHGGTLDPFATGLLIILTGTACKQAGQFLNLDKTYQFSVVLGKASTTGDPEGDITDVPIDSPISKHAVEATLDQFRGDTLQTPPAFSAIKINGKRAYDLARAGKEVVLEPRRVTIHHLALVEYAWPEATFVAHVSSGTYIRTLAEDIGHALGTAAYCTALRRTIIGSYSLADAKPLDDYIEQQSPEQ